MNFTPTRLHDVVGQNLVDCEIWLEDMMSNDPPDCVNNWLFVGPGGTGKSTSANIIADTLAGDMDVAKLGMGNMDHTSLKEILRAFQCRPMTGRYRVIIMEEFGEMTAKVQQLLKTELDLGVAPRHLVVVACSNCIKDIEDPLVQRFNVVQFLADTAFRDACEDRLCEMWAELMPRVAPPPECQQWGITSHGKFSMRKAVRDMQMFARRKERAYGNARQVEQISTNPNWQ